MLIFIVGRFRKGFSDHAAFVVFKLSDQSLTCLVGRSGATIMLFVVEFREVRNVS